MDSVELVLESVGNDYPGLVREALAAKEPDSSCSASLSSCGYAWLIIGQTLYVWKYDAEEDYAYAPAILNLPPSGLPYNAQTVCVYKRQGFSTSGIIAVTPEGIVRHWSMPDRQFSDNSIDLDREVVLSLTRINLQSSDGICFLLATTTCSLFLLNVNTSIAPTPGKRQRLSSEITVKIIHTNARTGIGGKLASAIFGEGRQSESRQLIKALIYEQSNDELMNSLSNVSSSLSSTAAGNMHILAVTEDHLLSYSMRDSTRIWNFELANMASEHFALDLWNLHDFKKHNHWREKIKTWILDAVNIRNGALILFACNNKAVSTQIHFAFGFVSEYDGSQPPIGLEWFCILKILSNEYKSSEKKALAKIALRLPANSEQVLADKIEDILLVTQKTIYSFRLPDRLLKKTPLKLVLCAMYNSTLISSARDARYCYIFLEENGLQRVRLLPRGFDANLAQTVAQMSKMHVHAVNFSSSTSDRRELTRAFYLFSRADLHEASDIMRELLANRYAGIAQICVDYAVDLVDDVPNDERWKAAEHSSLSGAVTDRISSKSSFLLEVHLEEKKKVLAMFILFIKTVGLDDKLNRTVKTRLCQSHSARSQIVELIEKIDIAIALYKWSKHNREVIFDAAMERILSKRKESVGGDREFLTRYDYFFREVSRVQELFSGLIEEEEGIVGNDNETLDDKLECIKYVGSALIIGKKAIDEHRDDIVLDIENDLRWTQEKSILRPFIKHLSILFNHLDQVGRDSPKYATLLKQGVLISAFVMNEQIFDDRQNSPIVAKFLEISEYAVAVELAKRFQDYKTIIRLACALPDLERKTKIEEYKEFFSSGDFCNTLYEYYLENGYIRDLLEMKEPDADLFFATQTNVGWMRELENCDFAKACHTLKALSRKSNDDVILKRRLLSFAKISALCQDQVDNNFLESVKCDLSLIKHQQKIDSNLEMKFNLSKPTSKIRSYTAEEIIRAHLNNSSCDVDQCFDALLTLSILMDKEASNHTVELIRSLQIKIWISAIRANSDYWKKLTQHDDSRCSTVYCELLDRITAYAELSNERKLELIPDAKELAECLTEFAHNKLFAVLLQTSEEAAKRNILRNIRVA